jgi:hypothetical protein
LRFRPPASRPVRPGWGELAPLEFGKPSSNLPKAEWNDLALPPIKRLTCVHLVGQLEEHRDDNGTGR